MRSNGHAPGPRQGRAEGVKSAERVLDVIELLTREPLGLTFVEITAELGWPKSSSHALLQTMTRRGYLSLDEASRRYTIGLRIWEAGQAYNLYDDLVRQALPVMERVVDDLDEIAQLAIRDGRYNVYLAKVDCRQPMQLISSVGRRLPCYATGLGKALLAELSDPEIDQLYPERNLPRFTPSTIGDVEALKSVLAEVRQRGYATDNEEYTRGLRCIAVPIHGRAGETLAALSCSIPSARLDAGKFQRALELLQAAAGEISARLAGRPAARRAPAPVASRGRA
jgi:DNA-binding IclR family transcriptional regulator